RSCSCCSDLRKSAVPASAVFSWLASAPALVATAVCVSTSRRAAARSCSSRPARSCSCCCGFRQSAVPASAVFFFFSSSPALFAPCLAREGCLRLDIAAGGCEFLLQPAGAVVFLLQRLAQIRCPCVCGLFQLACLGPCLGCERRLRLDIAAGGCEILLQPAG